MFIRSKDNPDAWEVSRNKSTLTTAHLNPNTTYAEDDLHFSDVESDDESCAEPEKEEADELDSSSIRYIVVALVGMCVIAMAIYGLGYERILLSEEEIEKKYSHSIANAGALKRHKIFLKILQSIIDNCKDNILIDRTIAEDAQLKSKEFEAVPIIIAMESDAELKDLLYFNANEMEDIITDDLESMDENVMSNKYLLKNNFKALDINQTDVHWIKNRHFNFSALLGNISDIKLLFMPAMVAFNYDSPAKSNSLRIFSDAYMEAFEVVITFSHGSIDISQLNLVCITMKEDEYMLRPVVLDDGTADLNHWIIEVRHNTQYPWRKSGQRKWKNLQKRILYGIEKSEYDDYSYDRVMESFENKGKVSVKALMEEAKKRYNEIGEGVEGDVIDNTFVEEKI